MQSSIRPLLVLGIVGCAAGALAWNHETSWHDPVTNTATASAKPGGGGIYGTGSPYEGGIRCAHCHLPATVSPPISVNFTFSPTLTGGHYAAGTRYTITVDLIGEHFLQTDGGSAWNNFAGSFTDANGALAGLLESDSGQVQNGCPATAPATFPAGSTTLLYGDCHGILSRFINPANRWTFSWTAPAATTGTLTFHYGVVDGDGNDRTMGLDGGPDDAVLMGSMTLLP